MERALTIVKAELYHIVNGAKVLGLPSGLYGDISSGLYGDISGLYGDISSGLYGNISSGLYGDISGLYGDISGLSGDISDCKITKEDRSNGINIKDLIK